MAAFRFGFRLLAVLTLLGGLVQAGLAKDEVTADVILSYKPAQKGVEYTMPSSGEVATCTIELEETGKAATGKATTAWVVKDARGAILRKFHDTLGAGGVNMYAYYKDGEEVYREMAHPKPRLNPKTGMQEQVQVFDEYRWLGPNGSKWGVDLDGDGKIDTWLVISPEELSQELLAAVIAKDKKRLDALMMTPADLASLGLPIAEVNRIQAKMAGAAAQFAKICQDPGAPSDKAMWVHLERKLQETIAADALKAKEDLVRYRHAAILFQEGEGEKAKHNWVQTGELIQVGKAWRMVQGPVLGMDTGPDIGPGPEPTPIPPGAEGIELMKKLNDLDAKGPTKPGREGIIEYNLLRAGILEQIVGLFKKPEQRSGRDFWLKPVADSLAAAAQQGDKAGLDRLGQWKTSLLKDPASIALPYFAFREMTAQYAQELSKVGPKPEELTKLQETWKAKLTKFISDYPSAEDTPDAIMQLGMVNEFFGPKAEEETKAAYGLLVKNFPTHPLARRAQGCLNRVSLEGKEMELSGPVLGTGNLTDIKLMKGKAVVVYYWASWNENAAGDFNKIKNALKDYAGKAELLGVNLDAKAGEASAFLMKNPVEGSMHIHVSGGQDSPLAIRYGITALPVMFIVGPDGKVVNRQGQASTLDDDLKKMFKTPEKDK
jgi:Thioredoxin-like